MQCSTIFVFAFFSTFIIIFLSVILIGIFNWSHFDQFAIDTRNELVPIKSLNLPPVRDHKTITYRNKFRSALSSYNVEQWNINLVAAVLSYEKNMHAFWNSSWQRCDFLWASLLPHASSSHQRIFCVFQSISLSRCSKLINVAAEKQANKSPALPPSPNSGTVRYIYSIELQLDSAYKFENRSLPNRLNFSRQNNFKILCLFTSERSPFSKCLQANRQNAQDGHC